LKSTTTVLNIFNSTTLSVEEQAKTTRLWAVQYSWD